MSNFNSKLTRADTKQVWELTVARDKKIYKVVFLKNREIKVGLPENHERLEAYFAKIVNRCFADLNVGGDNTVEFHNDEGVPFLVFTNHITKESRELPLSVFSLEDPSSPLEATAVKLHNFSLDYLEQRDEEDFFLKIFSEICALLATPFVFLYELFLNPYGEIRGKAHVISDQDKAQEVAFSDQDKTQEVNFEPFLHHLDFTQAILRENFEPSGEGAVVTALDILAKAKKLGLALKKAHDASDTAKRGLINKLGRKLRHKTQRGEKFLLPIRLEEHPSFAPSLLFFMPRGDGSYDIHCITCLPKRATNLQDHTIDRSWRVSSNTMQNVTFFKELLALHSPYSNKNPYSDRVERTDKIGNFFKEEARGAPLISLSNSSTSNPTSDPLETLFFAMNLVSGEEIDIFSTRAKFYHAFLQKFITYVEENQSILTNEERIEALKGLKFYAQKTKAYLEEEIGSVNANSIFCHFDAILGEKVRDLELAKILAENQYQGLNQKMIPALQNVRLTRAFYPPAKVVYLDDELNTLRGQGRQKSAAQEENFAVIPAISPSNFEKLQELEFAFSKDNGFLIRDALGAIIQDAEQLLGQGPNGAEAARVLLTGAVSLLPIEEAENTIWFHLPKDQINTFSRYLATISQQFFESIVRSSRSQLGTNQLFAMTPKQKFEFGVTLFVIQQLLAFRKLSFAKESFETAFVEKIEEFNMQTEEFASFSHKVVGEMFVTLTAPLKVKIEAAQQAEIEILNNEMKKTKQSIQDKETTLTQLNLFKSASNWSGRTPPPHIPEEQARLNEFMPYFQTYEREYEALKKSPVFAAITELRPAQRTQQLTSKGSAIAAIAIGILVLVGVGGTGVLGLLHSYKIISLPSGLAAIGNLNAIYLWLMAGGAVLLGIGLIGYGSHKVYKARIQDQQVQMREQQRPAADLWQKIHSLKGDDLKAAIQDALPSCSQNSIQQFVATIDKLKDYRNVLTTRIDQKIDNVTSKITLEKDKLESAQKHLRFLKEANYLSILAPLKVSFLEHFSRLADGSMLQGIQLSHLLAKGSMSQGLQNRKTSKGHRANVCIEDLHKEIVKMQLAMAKHFSVNSLNLPNLSSSIILDCFSGDGNNIYHFYLGRLLKQMNFSTEILGDYVDCVNLCTDPTLSNNHDFCTLLNHVTMRDELLVQDRTILVETGEFQKRREGAKKFYEASFTSVPRLDGSKPGSAPFLHTYEYEADKTFRLSPTLLEAHKNRRHSEALIKGYHFSFRRDKKTGELTEEVADLREIAKLHQQYATGCVDSADFESQRAPLISLPRANFIRFRMMKKLLLNPVNMFSRVQKDRVVNKLARPQRIAELEVIKREILSLAARAPRVRFRQLANFIKVDQAPVPGLKNECIHCCYSPGFALCTSASQAKMEASHVVEFEYYQSIVYSLPFWQNVEMYSSEYLGRRGTAALLGQIEEEAFAARSCQNTSFQEASEMQKIGDQFLTLGGTRSLSINSILQIFHYLDQDEYLDALAKEPLIFDRLYSVLYQSNLLPNYLKANRHQLVNYLEIVRGALLKLDDGGMTEHNVRAILFVNLLFDSVRDWVEHNIQEGDDLCNHDEVMRKIQEISRGQDRITYAEDVFAKISLTTRQKFGSYLYLIVWDRTKGKVTDPIIKNLIKARFFVLESKTGGGHLALDAIVNQIWGEKILSIIVKDCKDIDELFNWISACNAAWVKNSKENFVYQSQGAVQRRVDLQNLSGDIDGLFLLLGKAKMGELPYSVYENEIFKKVFGKNFYVPVHIFATKGGCEKYQWYDLEKKVLYTILFLRQAPKEKQVQIIQEFPSGQAYIYSDNTIVLPNPFDIMTSGMMGAPQDLSQLDRIINEKGMWVELSAPLGKPLSNKGPSNFVESEEMPAGFDRLELEKDGKVLVSLSGQDIQNDPLVLVVKTVVKGETLLGKRIRNEPLVITTIQGAYVGEGEHKKHLYSSGFFTQVPTLLCREPRGVLFFGKNNIIEEIRFPTVQEYSRVFQGSQERGVTNQDEADTSLVLERDENNSNLWLVQGDKDWHWQIEGTPKLDKKFGKQWRDYVLPLFNPTTNRYRYIIFPYFIYKDSSHITKELVVVREVTQLLEMSSKTLIQLFTPAIKFLIENDPNFAELCQGDIPIDIMPKAGEIFFKMLKNYCNLTTTSIVSIGLHFLTNDNFVEGLVNALLLTRDETQKSRETKRRILRRLLENILQSFVPHSFQLTESNDGEHSSHFGFFYLSYLHSLQGDYNEAGRYLVLMRKRGVSDDYSVMEFQAKLPLLLGLSTFFEILDGLNSDVLENLRSAARSGQNEAMLAIALRFFSVFSEHRDEKETAFRIKQIYALLTISKKLALAGQVNILGPNELIAEGMRAVLQCYAAFLYGDYQKMTKTQRRVLADEDLLLKKEEEGLARMLYNLVQVITVQFRSLGNVSGGKSKAFNQEIVENPFLRKLVHSEEENRLQEMVDLHNSQQISFQETVPTWVEITQLIIAADNVRGDPSITTVDAVHEKCRSKQPSWQTLLAYFPVYVYWVLHQVEEESELAFLKVPLHTANNSASSELNVAEDPDLHLVAAIPKVYRNSRKAPHSDHVNIARAILIYLWRMKDKHPALVNRWQELAEQMMQSRKAGRSSQLYRLHEGQERTLQTFFNHPTLLTGAGYLYNKLQGSLDLLELEPNENKEVSYYRQCLRTFLEDFHGILEATPDVHKAAPLPTIPLINFTRPPVITSLPVNTREITLEDYVEIIKQAIIIGVKVSDPDVIRDFFLKITKKINHNSLRFSIEFVISQVAGAVNTIDKHVDKTKIAKTILNNPVVSKTILYLANSLYNLYKARVPQHQQNWGSNKFNIQAGKPFVFATRALAEWYTGVKDTKTLFKELIVIFSGDRPELSEFLIQLSEDPNAILELTNALLESVKGLITMQSELLETTNSIGVYQSAVKNAFAGTQEWQTTDALVCLQVINNFIINQLLQKGTESPLAVQRKKQKAVRQITEIVVRSSETYVEEREFFKDCFSDSNLNDYQRRYDAVIAEFAKNQSEDERVRLREERSKTGLLIKKDELTARMQHTCLLYSKMESLKKRVAKLFAIRTKQAKFLEKKILDLADRYRNILEELTSHFVKTDGDSRQNVLHIIFELYQEEGFYHLNNLELQGQFEEDITEYLIVQTEINLLRDAASILKKMDAMVRDLKLEQQIEDSEVQSYLNENYEWIAKGVELKNALLRGGDRYRFCHYNEYRMIDGVRVAPILEEPGFSRRFLVKEYYSGCVSRKTIIDASDSFLADFTTSEKAPKRVARLRTGEGKTSWFISIARMICHRHDKDPVVITTVNLVDQLHGELGFAAYRFDFDKNFGIVGIGNGEQPQAQVVKRHLKNVVANLESLRREKKFVLTTPTARAAVIIKLSELPDQIPFVNLKTTPVQAGQALFFIQLQLVQRVDAYYKKEDTVTLEDEEVNHRVDFEYNKATGKDPRSFDRTIYQAAEKIIYEMLLCPVLAEKIFNNSLMSIPPFTSDSCDEIYRKVDYLFKNDVTDEEFERTILESIVHTQAYLFLRILHDEAYWIRKSGYGALGTAGAGFTTEEYRSWDKKVIFEFIFASSVSARKSTRRPLEGVLPHSGYDPRNPHHEKYHFIDAMKFLLGFSKPFTSVYKTHATKDRRLSQKTKFSNGPAEDEREKPDVSYGNECENVLQQFLAYVFGQKVSSDEGDRFTSQEEFRRQLKKFEIDSETSIELPVDITRAFDSSDDPVIALRNELKMVYAKTWVDWAANINKVANHFGQQNVFEVFARIPPKHPREGFDFESYSRILVIERLQYLKWAAYESGRMIIYPEQYVCNSQSIPGEDVRIASATGDPVDLNLAKIGEIAGPELVTSENLLLVDDLEVDLFSSPLEHIKMCLENSEYVGVTNSEFELGDTRELIKYLRSLDYGRNRQFHWGEPKENGEIIKYSWDVGAIKPRKYSHDRVNEGQAFYYYPIVAKRGVDLRMPKKNQCVSHMIGLSTDIDTYNQIIGRPRQLGYGQYHRLALDDKMNARVSKQNNLQENEKPTTFHVVRSIERYTLDLREFLKIKAVNFAAKNIIANKFLRVRDAPYDLQDSDYDIIEQNEQEIALDSPDANKHPVREIVAVLGQLQRVLAQTCRPLVCQKNEIDWAAGFRMQKKYNCMEYLQHIHTQEEYRLIGLRRDFHRRIALLLFSIEPRFGKIYKNLPTQTLRERLSKSLSTNNTLRAERGSMYSEVMDFLFDRNNHDALVKMTSILLKRPAFNAFYANFPGELREHWAGIEEWFLTVKSDDAQLHALLEDAANNEKMMPFDHLLIDFVLLNNTPLSVYLNTLYFMPSEDFEEERTRLGSSQAQGLFSQIANQFLSPTKTSIQLLTQFSKDKVLENFWEKIHGIERASRQAKYELLLVKTLLGNNDAKDQLQEELDALSFERRKVIVDDLLKTEYGNLVQDYLNGLLNGIENLPSIENQRYIVKKYFTSYIKEVFSDGNDVTNMGNEVEQNQESQIEMEQSTKQERDQNVNSKIDTENPIGRTPILDIRKFLKGKDKSFQPSFTHLTIPQSLFYQDERFAISAHCQNLFKGVGRRNLAVPYLFVSQNVTGSVKACLFVPQDLDEAVAPFIDQLTTEGRFPYFMKVFHLHAGGREKYGNKYGLPSSMKGTPNSRTARVTSSFDAKVMQMFCLGKLYMGLPIKDYTSGEIATVISIVLELQSKTYQRIRVLEAQIIAGNVQADLITCRDVIARGKVRALENFLDSNNQDLRAYRQTVGKADEFASTSFIEQIWILWLKLDNPKLARADFLKIKSDSYKRLLDLILDMRILHKITHYQRKGQLDIQKFNFADRYRIVEYYLNPPKVVLPSLQTLFTQLENSLDEKQKAELMRLKPKKTNEILLFLEGLNYDNVEVIKLQDEEPCSLESFLTFLSHVDPKRPGV